jgi:hypothetical protein
MPSAADIDAMIDAAGEPIVLRRIAMTDGIQTSTTDVSMNGKVNYIVNPHRLDEVVRGGPVVQTDCEVRLGTAAIAAASWPVPPRKDDQVQIGGQWATVRNVQTLRSTTETLGYVLQVRG